jgi:hypothetical protein
MSQDPKQQQDPRERNTPNKPTADQKKTTEAGINEEGSRGNPEDIKEEKAARKNGNDVIGLDR